MSITYPPFDPELKAFLEANDYGLPPLSAESLPVWREYATPGFAAVEDAVHELGLVHEERVIARRDGGELTLSIIRQAVLAEPAPLLYLIHSGGMVVGDRFLVYTQNNHVAWAAEFGAILITPEYRLAPESPAPAGAEDCYDGLLWAAANADELGVDLRKVIVGGVSGGGGLAAAVSLMVRDFGGPEILGQLLLCPQLDDRHATPSAQQYADAHGTGGGWSREASEFAWNALLGEGHAERDDISVYAAPGRAADLSGLPPAFIDVGSAEVFRDDAVAYASRMWAAGTQAELHVWAGGYHGFDTWAVNVPVAASSRSMRSAWLRRVLED